MKVGDSVVLYQAYLNVYTDPNITKQDAADELYDIAKEIREPDGFVKIAARIVKKIGKVFIFEITTPVEDPRNPVLPYLAMERDGVCYGAFKTLEETIKSVKADLKDLPNPEVFEDLREGKLEGWKGPWWFL